MHFPAEAEEERMRMSGGQTLAEKWNGQGPTSVIPGTTVPMIGVGTALGK